MRIKVPAAPGRAVANAPSIALNGMGWGLGIAVRCGTPGAAAAPRPAALQPHSPAAPLHVPACHKGLFERGQLAAALGGEICSWGEKQIHFQELRWNGCQFPKQNCHFSVRMTVASEPEGCYFQLKMPSP